jgi:hypothetical protein
MHIDENKKFDKRTIERNLKEGIISEKEWEALLKNLPDVSDKVALIDREEERKQPGKGAVGEKKR